MQGQRESRPALGVLPRAGMMWSSLSLPVPSGGVKFQQAFAQGLSEGLVQPALCDQHTRACLHAFAYSESR